MINNIATFTYFELADLFGADSIINISTNSVFTGISTDSRKIEKGNIFIALKGENSDGHDKIYHAFENGSSACIVEKEWYKSNNDNFKNSDYPMITVKNTLNALGALARFHRNRFTIPIIMVCGSNGKTTTKEMISAILEKKFKVLKTHENFNNQIGVPLMLLQLNEEHEIAVLEAGTNEPGEIAILSEIISPTHGIITNIGREHLEKLIDLDGVEMEETFLFGYLKKHGGTAFINNDDNRLRKYTSVLDKYITYGVDENSSTKGEINIMDNSEVKLKIIKEDIGFEANLKSKGHTSAINALAATAIGLSFDVPVDLIKQTLEEYENKSNHGYGRMVIEELGQITLINDCYNANPDSMKSALEVLSSFKRKRKIAVLGDMRELGDASFIEHKNLIKNAVDIADIIMITGPEMGNAFNDLVKIGKISYFEDKEKLANELIKIINDGDIILVKGSRGMSMENIVEVLRQNIK